MGQCLETASIISTCERGTPGGWSSMIMPSTSRRENGFSTLYRPSIMREATISGWVPPNRFSRCLMMVLKEVIPGPSQLEAADSRDRYECSSARTAVFPLPHLISGNGLIIGNASLAASRRQASCNTSSKPPSVLRTLGNLRSATSEDFSESMVWWSVLSIA